MSERSENRGLLDERNMKYYEITELYRQIGREFRALGAERVILVSSRVCKDSEREMFLEVAVEGSLNSAELQQHADTLWPQVAVKVIIIEEMVNRLDEMEEDGIVL